MQMPTKNFESHRVVAMGLNLENWSGPKEAYQKKARPLPIG
jgi:hypothetical protein